jgi:RNA polymerase sigma factor (sigma-70 family)
LTEDGFASFYLERFGRTMVMLIVMGASRADAEDAVQEAMFLAWRQWDKIERPDAWVRKVAIRTYCKQVGIRRQTVPLDESRHQAVVDGSDPSLFAEQQQVLRTLRSLPVEQRMVMALHYDEATCEEIATLTDKPPATVRSLRRHARKALKEMMSSGDT